MPTRDTAQLLLEVDARIATAQRAVNQLARSIQTDADNMGNSLKKVEQAHDRLGKTFNDNGRMRSGLTQLSFQIGDVTQQMSMGVRASTIFAQQSGQVIQALQVMGGEGNKFLQFLGGPWGIAISTAVVILGSLSGKLFDSGDELGKLVDKMREQARQAELNEQANRIWENSLDGLIDKTRKLYEETERAQKTPRDLTRQNLGGEQGRLDAYRRRQGEIQAELSVSRRRLAEAERALARTEGSADGPGAVLAAQGVVDKARQRVTDLAREFNDLTVSIGRSAATVDNLRIEIARLDAADIADPVTAKFARLRKEAEETIKDVDKLARRLVALGKQEAAERARSSAGDNDLTRFISPVSGARTGRFGEQRTGRRHAGLDLAVPVGTSVAAAAAGTVIEVGSLPGYGNVVVIDHGRGTTTRYAHLSKFLAAKGQQVAQGDVIALSGGAPGAPGAGNSRGPHVHYEVRRGGRAVDPGKGSFPTDPAFAGRSAARSVETEAERQLRQQNAFEEKRDQLNQELLRAQADLVFGIADQAKIAEEQVRADKARRDLALQNDVEEQKLTQAQAEELKAINASIADARTRQIEREKQIRLIQQQSDREQRTLEYQIEDLRFADEMASTQSEHRRVQLEILDIVYEQKEARLRALKAELELAGKMEEAAAVQTEIDRLPGDKARDRERTRRSTRGPLEEWADSVPQTAEEVIEALQAIEARGLDSLSDAIADVVMGTRSLKDAFGDLAQSIIADIIRMTIRMLIFRALTSAFGGLFGGGGGGGLYEGIPGDLVPVEFRAAGGPVTAGRAYVVGERRPELFVPATNGTIIPRVEMGSAGGQAGASSSRVEVVLNDPLLQARIAEGADVRIVRAYPGIQAGVVQTIDQRQRRR